MHMVTLRVFHRTVPSENSHKDEEHIQEHSNTLKIRLHNCIEQQTKVNQLFYCPLILV